MLDNILKFKEELEQLCIKYNIFLDGYIDVCSAEDISFKSVHYNYNTSCKTFQLYDVFDVNNERLY